MVIKEIPDTYVVTPKVINTESCTLKDELKYSSQIPEEGVLKNMEVLVMFTVNILENAFYILNFQNYLKPFLEPDFTRF